MACVTQSGFVSTAKRLVGATPAVFASMALGYGASSDTAASIVSALATEVTVAALTRQTAATADAAGSSATASDTCRFVGVWTCSSDLATTIKECGVFNSATGGEELCYGTFATGIPMSSGDTLQVTWSVTVKAG